MERSRVSDEPLFDLRVVGRLSGSAPAPHVDDSYTVKRRQAAEDGRLAVQPFINEALLFLVHTMRTTKSEEIRTRIALKILDRGWGLPKPLPPDDPGAVGNGNSIIDLLAAASQHAGRLERNGSSALPPPPVADKLPEKLEVIEIDNAEDAQFIEFLNKGAKDA